MSPRLTNSKASSPFGLFGASNSKKTPLLSILYDSVPLPLLLRAKTISRLWYIVIIISLLSNNSFVTAHGFIISRSS